jgi:hypothetical protein
VPTSLDSALAPGVARQQFAGRNLPLRGKTGPRPPRQLPPRRRFSRSISRSLFHLPGLMPLPFQKNSQSRVSAIRAYSPLSLDRFSSVSRTCALLFSVCKS